MKKTGLLIVLICMVFVHISCKKWIAVDTPGNQLTTDKVFEDSTSAKAALLNIYSLYDKTIDANYNKWLGLYTDEVLNPNGTAPEFTNSLLGVGNSTVLNIWKNNYFAIYSCNDLIEQLKLNSNFPEAMRKNLIAEATLLRAYSYFYLVNTFGAVPLELTTNVNINAKMGRTEVAVIYAQLESDLKDAQNELNGPVTVKTRANKWAAAALLAKVYLYQQKWALAEATANVVINSGLFTPLQAPSNVFQAGSKETILQFWTQNGYITDATSLIPSSGRPTYPLTTALINAFDNNDLRKSNWMKSTLTGGVTYYYPYKYHNRSTNTTAAEYLCVLRVAEQYLIRAEARAQQNNVAAALQDLTQIRNRAAISNLPEDMSQADCLNAIYAEWRKEFFMEWGNRFLTLKRTGQLNKVMTAYKSTWNVDAVLFPIPQSEITYNHNLTQNNGYQKQ